MTETDRPLITIPFEVPERVFTEAPKPFGHDYGRRCFRLLRMASILHMKGFQGLRVRPYMHPLAYRIEFFPAAYANLDGVSYLWDAVGGWMDRNPLIATYSGADGSRYFGWEDVSGASAHDLAVKFVERFPELAKATYHLDFEYAGWFATLLGHCEYGYLPYLYAEFESEIGVMRLHKIDASAPGPDMKTFPFPPRRSAGAELLPRPRPAWMSE
ncbi:MAG: hypothetical protein ACOYKF_11815 [Phenylobacterium sp.]